MKVWSYNAESCLIQDRVGGILRTARAHGVSAVGIQGTLMTGEVAWLCEDYVVYPCPRSDTQKHDGCLVALWRRQSCNAESCLIQDRVGEILRPIVPAGQRVTVAYDGGISRRWREGERVPQDDRGRGRSRARHGELDFYDIIT